MAKIVMNIKMIDIEKVAREEEQRLKTLLFSCGIPETRINMLGSVIENTAWMKAKLDDTREQIRNTSVAIPYDNGGGQSGIRENPLFKGYSGLWKSYMSGMNTIMGLLPRDVADTEISQIEKPKTMLEAVREKHERKSRAAN